MDYQYSTNVSPVESKVAYITLRHGDGVFTRVHSWDIVTSGIDGTDYERLTSEKSVESNPVWSPDGMHIAFYSSRDGTYAAPFSLFAMDVDGSNVRNLTLGTHVIELELPVWSPDGERIAFWVYEPTSREDRSYDWALYIVNSDGSGLKRISRTASHLAWSPDGKYLAFMMNDPFENPMEKPTLAIAELDGRADVRHIPIRPTPETPGEHTVNARALTWSKDGSRLEFVTCHVIRTDNSVVSENVRVYSLDSSGMSEPQLIARWNDFPRCPQLDLVPAPISFYTGYEMAWSPDRSQMAVLEYSRTARIGRHPFFDSLFVISVDGIGFKHLVLEGEDGHLVAANPSQ